MSLKVDFEEYLNPVLTTETFKNQMVSALRRFYRDSATKSIANISFDTFWYELGQKVKDEATHKEGSQKHMRSMLYAYDTEESLP